MQPDPASLGVPPCTGRYVRLKDSKYAVAMQACIPRDIMQSFVVYHDQDRATLRDIINSTVRG